jgi:thiamine kinase-like enzyme
MIPQEKQPAVVRALQEAFGVYEFEDIRLLAGGLSTALVFRIVVQGAPYLLRLLMRTDKFSDPASEFAYMQAAAGAGIAPRIWYASIEDRVLLTDFVEARSYPQNMALLMAGKLRELHSLEPFPKRVNYFDAIDGFIRRFQTARILPESKTEELFSRYAAVARVYPRDGSDLVASHNDLKPQNTLFDGARVWLVDWEAAFRNDRYLDLAVVANFFLKEEAEEEAYLNEYFGESAGEYRRSRFYLMRQILHMSYGTCFMSLAAATGISIDPDIVAQDIDASNLDAPDFRNFHQRIISGDVDLATAEAKVQYAKVHLNQLLRNMRTQRFEDAVTEVAAFQAGA